MFYNMYIKRNNKYSIYKNGGAVMATSSITTDFVISGKEAVERFADAIEASANTPERPMTVNVCELHGEELMEFIKRTIEVNVKR